MRCPSSELLKALYFSLFNDSYHTGICFMHILYICFSLSTELFPPWDLGPHIACVLVITLIFVPCARKMFSKYLSNQYIYYDNNDAYDSNSLFYSSVLWCLCCILLGIWRIYICIYIYTFFLTWLVPNSFPFPSVQIWERHSWAVCCKEKKARGKPSNSFHFSSWLEANINAFASEQAYFLPWRFGCLSWDPSSPLAALEQLLTPALSQQTRCGFFKQIVGYFTTCSFCS